jgi:hypothetical protein
MAQLVAPVVGDAGDHRRGKLDLLLHAAALAHRLEAVPGRTNALREAHEAPRQRLPDARRQRSVVAIAELATDQHQLRLQRQLQDDVLPHSGLRTRVPFEGGGNVDAAQVVGTVRSDGAQHRVIRARHQHRDLHRGIVVAQLQRHFQRRLVERAEDAGLGGAERPLGVRDPGEQHGDVHARAVRAAMRPKIAALPRAEPVM